MFCTFISIITKILYTLHVGLAFTNNFSQIRAAISEKKLSDMLKQ